MWLQHFSIILPSLSFIDKLRQSNSFMLNPMHIELHPLWDCMMDLQVLGEDENNVKALFRRGKARAELGQTDAAREDFLKAGKFAPEDKSIGRELRLLAEHEKAVYKKQKEIYKGIFGPRPEPKQKKNWLIIFWQLLVSLVLGLFKRKRVKAE